MLWFSKGNHRASLKHNTSNRQCPEFLKLHGTGDQKSFESQTDKVQSIFSVEIKPRVNTDGIKCILRRESMR